MAGRLNPDKTKKVLLVNLGGGVGDLLLSTALFSQIKNNFNKPEISIMIREEFTDVVKNHPYLDEIIPVKKGEINKKNFLTMIRKVSSKRFDVAIVLWSNAIVAWLLFFCRIPVRVGQGSRLLYSFLYTHRVIMRSERGDRESHWVECLLDYLRAIGCKIENPEVIINPENEDFSRADQILLQSGYNPENNKILIGLHVGKGMALDAKRWPVDFFAALGDSISERFNVNLMLTGSKNETELVRDVISRMKNNVINVAGKTSIKELAALIGRCSLFICPDSGPMHISAAMKIPTIGIFALKSDFPGRWGPYGAKHAIIRPKKVNCERNCIKEKCPRFVCYEQISVDEVLKAVEKLI